MWRTAITALTVVGAITYAEIGGALAQDYGGRGWEGHMGWWGPIGGVFMFLVMAAIVVGAVLLVRTLWHLGEGGRGSRNSALELLDERYARGEIEREEYQQRKTDLQR